jgi:rare lipoprotein A
MEPNPKYSVPQGPVASFAGFRARQRCLLIDTLSNQTPHFPTKTRPTHDGLTVVSTAWESALRIRSICLLVAVAQLLPLAVSYAKAEGQSGVASVYSTESGSRTASGARLNPGAMTAAHRSFPFGSRVRVTNRRNGRTVVVTVNDRGPFVRGRIIDVTPAAAQALGFSGLTQVTVERE